jgi:hypothetical protein
MPATPRSRYVKCALCGKGHRVFLCIARRGGGIFCSRACYGKAHRQFIESLPFVKDSILGKAFQRAA